MSSEANAVNQLISLNSLTHCQTSAAFFWFYKEENSIILLMNNYYLIMYRQTFSITHAVYFLQNLQPHRITVSVLVSTICSYRIMLIISLTVTLSCGCFLKTFTNILFPSLTLCTRFLDFQFLTCSVIEQFLYSFILFRSQDR